MNLRLLLLALALCCLARVALADELFVGGQTRTYSAIVPPGARSLPLVLVLHGNTQQGRDMRERSSWPQVAAQHKFVAVFPDGLNRSWADMRTADERGGASPPSGTDDSAFLLALVDHYAAAGIADPRRIYVTGVSNGGAMTLSLACQHPDRFAAVASVVMQFTPAVAGACAPKNPVPVLLMNGTADPLIPYAGGHSKLGRRGGSYLSAEQTLATWRRLENCAPGDAGQQEFADADPADRSTVTRIDSHCPPDREVVLYRVNGGGHRLPDRVADAQHPRLVDALLGPQNRDIGGPELIWQFLSRYSRPQ